MLTEKEILEMPMSQIISTIEGRLKQENIWLPGTIDFVRKHPRIKTGLGKPIEELTEVDKRRFKKHNAVIRRMLEHVSVASVLKGWTVRSTEYMSTHKITAHFYLSTVCELLTELQRFGFPQKSIEKIPYWKEALSKRRYLNTVEALRKMFESPGYQERIHGCPNCN